LSGAESEKSYEFTPGIGWCSLIGRGKGEKPKNEDATDSLSSFLKRGGYTVTGIGEYKDSRGSPRNGRTIWGKGN